MNNREPSVTILVQILAVVSRARAQSRQNSRLDGPLGDAATVGSCRVNFSLRIQEYGKEGAGHLHLLYKRTRQECVPTEINKLKHGGDLRPQSWLSRHGVACRQPKAAARLRSTMLVRARLFQRVLMPSRPKKVSYCEKPVWTTAVARILSAKTDRSGRPFIHRQFSPRTRAARSGRAHL